jgi:Ca-activated chloride channel family protein
VNPLLDWNFGFELLRTAWLPALCVAPLLLALGLWSLLARQSALRRLFDERFARRAQQQVSRLRGGARVGLCAGAALCFALALLGPTRGWSLREAREKGIDLVVCIDTSRSMLARDLRPDRLTRAKREVQGLLGQLAGNRLALVAFAGDARDVAPLTRDKTALARLLEPLSPDDNRQGGTNLGAPIERALALFDGRSGAHEAIVLVTDGEDLEGQGLAAATKAAERGIRTWVVGIGTAAGGKIPLSARDGREGYLADSDGQEVITQLAGATLERLATSTGGDYLSTEQSPTPLEDLYKLRIQRLETRALEQGLVRIPHDRYQWFLLPGLALALFAALIGERRAAPLAAVRAIARVLVIASGVALAAPSSPAAAQEAQPAAQPSAYAFSSARGLHELVEHVRAGRREEALALSSKLLERRGTPALDEATEAQVLYATGHALAGAKLPEDALRAFSSARVLAGPGELRLWSSYNAGAVALAQAEELRTARAAALAGAAPLAASPAPGAAGSAPGAAGGAAPPDPAAERAKVKQAYEQARALLLDRLRLDAPGRARGDADTRANLELAVRRLRELEREEQAEQEQQQRQQQQDPRDEQKKDPSQDSSSGSDPDAQSQPESQPDPSKQEPRDPQQQDPSKSSQGKPDPQQSQDEQPADSQGDPPQDQQDAQGEQKPDPKGGEPKPGEPQPGEQKPGEQKPGTEKPGDAQPPPAGLDPSKLTREELVQLLDRLAEIEKEAQRVRAAQRRVGRKPVEKDW